MLKIGIECESIEGQSWGVGRIVNKLLEEISQHPELEKDFRFFLYFKSKIPDYEYLKSDIFVKKVVQVTGIPKSFSLYYYIWLPMRLWFERLDVMFWPNYMLPAIANGKSIVILTEDVYYEARGKLPLQYRLAYRIFPAWAAKHATKIMTISETSRKNVAKLFKIPESRIFVNQLAVDLPKDLSSPRSYTLEPKPYLLYVGQAFPRRHLKETILAFEKLSHKFSDLSLVAVGADKYNPPIIKKLVEETNKKLGREAVIYKDYVGDEKLAQLYQNAKCLIYVSSREAFGLPPLEGLAYGTVPVVAEAELNREIYGDNAFFVPELYSVDSLVSTIEKALIDGSKRQQILQAAPGILAKYTWPAHTERFLALVKEIATKNNIK